MTKRERIWQQATRWQRNWRRNDRGNVMAMPAELNTTVVVTLEYQSPDGKVHRRVMYEGGQAVKIANLVGDLLDLVPPRVATTGETK